MFEAPIPGQSLTTTPKNAAWERPPQMVDIGEVVAFYMDNLSDEKKQDSIMQMLEQDVDVQTLTEGILRAGVAGGRHSVDVSLAIAPVIHEFIVATADAVGVDYKTGFEDKEDDETRQKKAGQMMARKKMLKEDPRLSRDMQAADVVEEVEERVEAEPKVAPKGLMSPR